ncbi:GPW/gp25 family protein [Desulfococcus sp.]|uniref:GPW/gp25 family protein n=1 Tax=Desulfococcus sp. TaxID=2025834 RepID=UPI00359335AF
MGSQPYRAMRFLHPDFDESGLSAGLQIAGTGGIDMVSGHAAVRQSVLMLLTTPPGERVMRPDYGCDLQQLVFSPNDATTHGLAIHYVKRALTRWEPRVEILFLDAAASAEDPGRMDIHLTYRLRRTGHREQLVIPVFMAEEA